MKNIIANCQSSNCFSQIIPAILGVALILFLTVGGLAQTVRTADYKADQALKSNARVNPSTQAMELSIPIGGYAGRAGNGLPIMFDYSSKVWQVKVITSWESRSGVKTDTKPMYAKRTAAGWTSNLGVPRIDYNFQMYKPFVEGGTYDGEIFEPYVGIDPDTNPPNYPVYYVKRMFVVMPDGSSHEFRKDDSFHNYGTSNTSGGPGLPDQLGNFLSVDGSRMRMEVGEQSKTLFMPDGSRYLFGSGDTATTFIDRHGNRMTYDFTNRRWTDTLGRIIDDPMPRNWYDFEQSQIVEDKVAIFPSKDGGTFNVTFSWRYLKDPQGGESGLEDSSQPLHNLSNVGCQGNANRPIPSPYLFTNPDPSLVRVCNPIAWNEMTWWTLPPPNPVVLTKITLPNGQKYEFKYNVYGEISKIIYPTGAYERFLYGQVPVLQPQGGSYDQANRGVLERWVSAKGDGTDELHWTYYNSTITAPDGTRTQLFLHTEDPDTPQPYGFGNAKTGRPYEERVLAPLPSNQILRRKLTSYEVTGTQTGGYAGATRDLRPNKEISVIFEPNESYALAQMTETIYDTNADPEYFARLNPKQIKTYNFIVLDLATAQTANIEQISALFTNANLSGVTEMDYLYDGNYKARNITGLVTETRVKDASGNVKAKSQIIYDESSYLEAVSVTSVTGWENPNTNFRGLPTTTRSWSDITNNQYIETHISYDQFGNARKNWDGRGNFTEVQYADNYSDNVNRNSYALPTKAISYSGANGTGTIFETVVKYDFSTGLPVSTTDANGQITTVEYNDPLLRPTKTIAPNGQQTITEYGAGTSAANRFVKVKAQIDAEKWKEGYTWFDGIGRAVKTQSVDSSGDVFTETEYDNMGRAKRVTNPYRAGETVYWTENFYDDLGRVIKVKTPDNAEVETFYSLATVGLQIGTLVTVEDQANRQRRSITNALGQLTRVDEPDVNNGNQLGAIDAPNQPTYYEYDTLNNLTKVKQGGTLTNPQQTRTFVYDSLSRLKSAQNPESGTISYTYDANGNLQTKRDARGIKTVYDYDALNRVAKRCYRVVGTGALGGVTCAGTASETVEPNTLDVTYSYDNLTNAKGKLTKVTTGDIAAPFSETSYLAFDLLGRVTQSRQMTDGVTYNPQSYVYNLSGALIEETYPSGRIVKNVLETDGDLSMVQSKKNANYGFFNFAKHFTYTAAGAVSSMQLGNSTWESTVFNSRLQPTQIALGNIQNATNLLKLNYDYGTTDNNGNVKSQQITVQRSNQSPLVLTQSYVYDSLNRLKSAEEKDSANQTTWKQTFTFDRYGNRRFDQANTTFPSSFTNPNVSNPQIDVSNNRFTTGQGYTYDLSGNLLTDAEGRTFTYDAENKQKTASNASGNLGTYFYDGDGKRVKKVTNAETIIFIYDAMGKLVAEYSTQLSQTPQVQYLTNDNLGTPRINTDQNGAVVSRSDYMPYGEEITGLGGRSATDKYVADHVRQGFTGYIKDDETGLDFAQARMYKKELGRFTGADPLLTTGRVELPQSWNRFSYVLNNPLVFVDPLGLYECKAQTGCDKIREAIANAEIQRDKYANDPNYGKNSKEYKAINRALDALGCDASVCGNKGKNGVTIYSGVLDKADGITKVQGFRGKIDPINNKNGQVIAVAFDTALFEKGNEHRLLETVVHEGTHVAQGADWVNSNFSPSKNPTRFDAEVEGYLAESYINQAVNPNGARSPYTMAYRAANDPICNTMTCLGSYQTWNSSWKNIDQERLKNVNGLVNAVTPNPNNKAFRKGDRIPTNFP